MIDSLPSGIYQATALVVVLCCGLLGLAAWGKKSVPEAPPASQWKKNAHCAGSPRIIISGHS